MSVYNGERHLREAIDSILVQTFTDFEFIIVDDGSTDRTAAILDDYMDPRIRRITNTTNIGLTKSLNIGLAACRGEFVARMDADDVSLPERLDRQVQHMHAHPEVGLLGTQFVTVDGDGCVTNHISCLPTEDVAIRWCLLGENAFAHASVMLRRSVLADHALSYDDQLPVAQDYDLWERMVTLTKCANLEGALLQYRRGGVSLRRREEQVVVRDKVSARAIERLLSNITAEDISELAEVIRKPDSLAQCKRNKGRLVGLWCRVLDSFREENSSATGVDELVKHLTRAAWDVIEREPPSVWRTTRVYRLARRNRELASIARGCLLEHLGYWRFQSWVVRQRPGAITPSRHHKRANRAP
jgi:hypothetical protein